MKLSKREYQIAGLAFCGLAKKEMAEHLGIAYGTINVLLDKAYKKTGTSKLNELGAWWINDLLRLDIDFKLLQNSIINQKYIVDKAQLINLIKNGTSQDSDH